MTHPVVIIGGGFAGLAAGVELAARGLRPIVLEARPELGGRARSFRDAATGETVDNGQHVLMGCYTHTLTFLARIGGTHKLRRQPNLRVTMAHRVLGRGAIAAATLPGPLHMLAGVLRYRLLRPRERALAVAGGMRLLAMHRRRDPRLAHATVAELLTALHQSPHAQASFWNPMAIATLNEAPERAAAAPFAAVLARAFFASRADSQFVLPGVGLSELYTGDARRVIERCGGAVWTHRAAVGLALADGRVRAVVLRDGTHVDAAACIAAVPPRALAPLLPPALQTDIGVAAPDDFGASPIVSVHLWLDRAVLADDFVGLLGATAQWLFNRTALVGGGTDGGQCLSAVISAGREVATWDAARITETVLADLRAIAPAAWDAGVRRSVVVKEKHATISTTPAVELRRPPATTPIDNLFLAGDWTATGLPPTIEGAVQSGHAAAGLVAERLGIV